MFWVKACGGGGPRGVLGPADAAAVGSTTRRATGLVLSLVELIIGVGGVIELTVCFFTRTISTVEKSSPFKASLSCSPFQS